MSLNSYRTGPDEKGHFGKFGGRYVSETLMPLVHQVEKAYRDAIKDPDYLAELDELNRQYIGRPNPLYYAERLKGSFRKIRWTLCLGNPDATGASG